MNKLRQADVELAKGSTMTGVCKLMAVSKQTLSAWRREYGGLKADQTKRSKELEKELEQENVRPKRFLAEAGLDKVILRESTSPN